MPAYLQLPIERLTIGLKIGMELSFLRVTGISSKKMFCYLFKDTLKENAPSNKTPVLMKSRIIGIWVVGTSNQLFLEVLKLK